MRIGPRAAAITVAGAAAVWHMIAGAVVGLGDAEALYYCYGLHPSLGYLDHPPMIGWLVGASTALFGDAPAAVRLVPTLCHGLTLAGAWALGRECFGAERAAWRAVAALALVPMMTIGGIAAAPDAPASALWLWSCVVLARGFRRWRAGEEVGVADGVLIGGLIGATFLAKYTGFLLIPAAVAASLHRNHRRLWRQRTPWAAAAVCALVAAPVVWWNATHGWASVMHRFVRTQGGFGPSLERLGATVGGQLAYLGPPMALALGWALLALVHRRRAGELSILLGLSAVPLGFTWALCLTSPAAEPHWPAQGYLALAVALGGLVASGGRWSRAERWVGGAAAALLALAMIALHLLVFTTLWPRLAGDDYESRWDLTNELVGWPEVVRAGLEVRQPGEPLAGSHYVICSQLVFNLARVAGRGAAPVLCLSEEMDDFDLWGQGSTAGRDRVLYVEDERFGRPAAAVLPGWDLEEVGRAEVRRGRWVVRRFRFVRAVRPSRSRSLQPAAAPVR